MTNITDHFAIGNKVEWITVKHVSNAIDIRKHEGTILEINGSVAVIKSPDYKRRRRISLFELKVID